MGSRHSCHALVPARDFSTGKSRLAGALNDETRHELGKWMLERVLDAVVTASGIDAVTVLSDGNSALALAESKGAMGQKCPANDLNADLEAGRKWALKNNAEMILIIPADLPALAPTDIDAMLDLAAKNTHPGGYAVITPSPDGGTNGLLLRPPGEMPFAFGPDSFVRHRSAAIDNSIQPILFENPGFHFDIDTTSDLALLAERGIAVPKWLSAICPA
jgi:2-phospho-L-lactate guanylyltransferase